MPSILLIRNADHRPQTSSSSGNREKKIPVERKKKRRTRYSTYVSYDVEEQNPHKIKHIRKNEKTTEIKRKKKGRIGFNSDRIRSVYSINS